MPPCGLLLLGILGLLGPAAPADRIDEILRDLGDDEFTVRESAQAALIAEIQREPEVRGRLRRSLDEIDDPETRLRIRRALLAASWEAAPALPVPPREYWASVSDGERFVLWGGRSGDGRRTDGAVFSDGAWKALPPARIDDRVAASVVHLGDELLVWGGVGRVPSPENRRGALWCHADGALYDLDEGTVREVPAAPIRGRVGADVVDLGDRVLVWGGTPSTDVWNRSEGRRSHSHSITDGLLDGAILDLGDLAWTRLPDRDFPTESRESIIEDEAAFLDGKLYVFAGEVQGGLLGLISVDAQAAYDVASGRWEEFPPCPVPSVEAVIALEGRLIAYGGHRERRNPGAGRTAILEGDAWTEIDRAPSAGYLGEANGGRVITVVDGGHHGGSVLDIRSKRWLRIPEPPDGGPYGPLGAWTGDEVLFWGPGRWKVGGGSWRPISRMPLVITDHRYKTLNIADRWVLVWSAEPFRKGRAARNPDVPEVPGNAAFYDLVADRWTVVPAMGPLAEWIRDPTLAWVGDRLLILAPDASRGVLWRGDPPLVPSAGDGPAGE